jgi:hypothetical protein
MYNATEHMISERLASGADNSYSVKSEMQIVTPGYWEPVLVKAAWTETINHPGYWA